MAGKSKKLMHPYIDGLMRQLGCENLTQMAEKTGIPYSTLASYAYEGRLPRRDTKLVEGCGVTLAELLVGLLNNADPAAMKAS